MRPSCSEALHDKSTLSLLEGDMKGHFSWLLTVWVYKINDRGANNIDSVSCVRTYLQVTRAQFM